VRSQLTGVKKKNYHLIGSNCQDFIENIFSELDKIGFHNNWMKDGPIRKYLKYITHKKEKEALLIYDPVYKVMTRPLVSHEDLREYYQHTLKLNKVNISVEEYKEEKQVIKCVERSWQISKKVPVVKPIFPQGPTQITYGL